MVFAAHFALQPKLAGLQFAQRGVGNTLRGGADRGRLASGTTQPTHRIKGIAPRRVLVLEQAVLAASDPQCGAGQGTTFF